MWGTTRFDILGPHLRVRPFLFSGAHVSDAAQRNLPAGITFREATEADAEEMIPHINAAFEVESFFVNRPRTHPGEMASRFRSGRFLLAMEAGRIVASLHYELRGERGHIGMLAVAPEWQHRGLGAAMMRAAEETLRARGCRIAELTVVSLRTSLFDFYRKQGYTEAGTAEIPGELRRKLTTPIELIRMEKAL
jgi:ribosomal protein S18 acetylase RimI-like enzyme